jgi:acyl carrier protein phosphodiesterase
MNWLAHAWLAGPDPETRLGNLLADLVKGSAREALGPGVLRGIAHHQAIDAFTDRHPLVLQSRRRIDPRYRRYAGILVDIFYDHILAQEWERYGTASLAAFTAQVYADITPLLPALPPAPREYMERLIELDVLGSYQRLEGVTHALQRISERLYARRGVVVALEASVAQLDDRYNELAQDFAGFFPELAAYARPGFPPRPRLSPLA